MADPRRHGPQQRSANHSELMTALSQRSQGESVNFCPFGCTDHDLDENGACAHLVGFYNGGGTYEPRVRRKKDGKIITDGRQRRPMKRGMKLVRITTNARVYSPDRVKDLVVAREEFDKVQADIMERERDLLAAAEAIRNPVLDGEWGSTGYGESAVAEGATAAAT